MYTVDWLIATDIHMIRVNRRTRCSLNIFWNINQNRSRFPCLCNIKSHLDDFSKILTISYGNTILCDTSRHSDNIYFLKCIVSNESKRYLPGKTYKRNAVIMCIRKTCHNIGCSRSARHKTDPDFSGRLCITFRLMNQSLLMARQYQINGICLI